MFGILKNLTQAAVGIVVDTPLSVVADVVTLGGAVTEEDKPYTVQAIERVVKNVKDAAK